MNRNPVTLSRIVDLSVLQALMDYFVAESGLAAAILDDKATPITYELGHCGFCREIRRTEAGLRTCRQADSRGIDLARQSGKLEFYKCDCGLVDFCGPIMVEGKPIAFFFGGQLRSHSGPLRTPSEPVLDALRKNVTATGEALNEEAIGTQFRQVRIIESDGQFETIREQAQEMLDILNGLVSRLHEWQSTGGLDEFMEHSLRVSTVDELLSLAVDSLPVIMAAGASSIFTVQRDQPGGQERLVLRKTSFGPLKPSENSAYYEKGEGLTGWVWSAGRSLRLSDLENPAERDSYEGLRWEHKHNDSDLHAGFLAAPMLGRRNQVIGVVRVPYKTHGIPFTERDEVLLNFIGRYLAEAIEVQALDEMYARAVGPAGMAEAATRLSSGLTYGQVLDTIAACAGDLFGRSGKKIFVNILEPEDSHWRIERMEGDLPLKAQMRRKVYAVGRGATGHVLKTGKAHMSSDIGESLRRQEYLPAVEEAGSFIAAPLRFGDEVYGAIAVVSRKKFDFQEGRDLRLLEGLGKIGGAAIRNSRQREEAMHQRELAYSRFARATVHYVANKTVQVEAGLDRMRRIGEQLGHEGILQTLRSCEGAMDAIKDLLQHFEAVGLIFDSSRQPVDLGELVQNVVQRAGDKRVVLNLSRGPLPVLVERFNVEQAIDELLANARRYASEGTGSVVVECGLSEVQGGQWECRASVTNDGPGIPEELRERIFEDGFTTGLDAGHVGVGLFIARAVARAHGGDVVLQEGTGTGRTTFVFSVPMRRGRDADD